jgi:hypothetical protein
MSTFNQPQFIVLSAALAACLFTAAHDASAAEPDAESQIVRVASAADLLADAERLHKAAVFSGNASDDAAPSERAAVDGCHGLRRIVPGAHLPEHACRLLVAEGLKSGTAAKASEHPRVAPWIAMMGAWIRSCAVLGGAGSAGRIDHTT